MPAYNLLVHHKLELFLSVYIPYVDHETVTGYGLHIVMQLIMATYAAAGHMTFDLFLTMTVSNYSAVVSILEFQFTEFEQMYKRRSAVRHRQLFLRNLLVQFTDAIQ